MNERFFRNEQLVHQLKEIGFEITIFALRL